MTATNHAGWCVEHYTTAHGWKQVSVTFATKAEAINRLIEMSPDVFAVHRVYEVLSC